MDVLARVGILAKGTVYVLVGVIATMLAFGKSTGETDQHGAMEELVQQPGGFVLLLIVALGMCCYAIWCFSEVAFGVAGESGAGPRLASLVRGVGYTLLAASAFTILAQGNSGSQAKQNQALTARIMHHEGGRWLVGIVGIVIAVVGIVLGYQGLTRSFEKQFKKGEMSAAAYRVTIVLGVVGGVARGLVVTTAGVLVLIAAVTFDPKKARGLDQALRSLRDAPAGPALLCIVAIGLVLFGFYTYCEARWRRV
jgi:lysylphosphatidylglycerol synthetase-like protein (DUF2156 family)